MGIGLKSIHNEGNATDGASQQHPRKHRRLDGSRHNVPLPHLRGVIMPRMRTSAAIYLKPIPSQFMDSTRVSEDWRRGADEFNPAYPASLKHCLDPFGLGQSPPPPEPGRRAAHLIPSGRVLAWACDHKC